jgi:UDP-N-acetylglucosamine transferase subunit ALG13
MIFVTVGTTKFDDLIQAVDDLAGRGLLEDNVVCQIGAGSYLPKYCEHFSYKPSIDEYLEKAQLVITHGGSTVLTLLKLQKPFISIANTALPGDHQSIFLGKLSEIVDIAWSSDPRDLPDLLNKIKQQGPATLSLPSLATHLSNIINSGGCSQTG